MIHKIIDEIKEMLREYKTLKNIDIEVRGYDHKYNTIFAYKIINLMHMVVLDSSLYRLNLLSVRMKHNGVETSKVIHVYAYRCVDSLQPRLT